MAKATRFQHWEGVVSGFLLGFSAALLCMMAYHEIRGLRRLNAWERSFEERHLDRSEGFVDRHLQVAMDAMKDGQPLATSRYLASTFMKRLYDHQMAYSLALLRSGKTNEFNELRATTGFLLLDFSGQTLTGLNLAGVDFMSADLSGVDLHDCDLSDANLTGADLSGANLSGADLSRSVFVRANLADAVMVGVRGTDTDFRQAVLVNASLTRCVGLEGAHFDDSELGQANLWASRFPGAHFDRADLTLASAVDADFSRVSGMTAADLTGVNFGGASLNAEAMQRTWLVGAEGLDSTVLRALRRNGAVIDPEEVLDLVDPRVVDGYRAQVEASAEVPAEQRRPALLSMLKGYYLQ